MVQGGCSFRGHCLDVWHAGGPLTPTFHGLGAPQLKLEEDMEHLREEMMKTEELQAKEEQTLAEWQVGARATTHGSQAGQGRPGWPPQASQPVKPLEGEITVLCGREHRTPERP